MFSNPDEPLTIDGAARILRLTTEQVHQLVAEGKLPHVEIGQETLIPYSAIVDWQHPDWATRTEESPWRKL